MGEPFTSIGIIVVALLAYFMVTIIPGIFCVETDDKVFFAACWITGGALFCIVILLLAKGVNLADIK